ncbi:hypothetical protein V9T40_013194 [Parthenolecanium corni]|uniref:Uncharacterized protein n=1 Tax=Parthenolecanium corni TaxID=536013 RepID=A0AAN9TIN7_9HEMI
METETETKLLGATSSRRRRWTKQRLTSRRLLAKTAIAVAATRRKARPARNSGSGTAETKRRLARAYRQVEVGSRRLTRRSGRASDGGNAAQRLRSTKRNDERRLGRTLGLDANWPWAAINSRVAGRCAARGLRRPTREPEVARNKGLAGQGRARGRDAEKRAATIRKSRMRTDENARSKRPKIEREKRDGTAHGAALRWKRDAVDGRAAAGGKRSGGGKRTRRDAKRSADYGLPFGGGGGGGGCRGDGSGGENSKSKRSVRQLEESNRTRVGLACPSFAAVEGAARARLVVAGRTESSDRGHNRASREPPRHDDGRGEVTRRECDCGRSFSSLTSSANAFFIVVGQRRHRIRDERRESRIQRSNYLCAATAADAPKPRIGQKTHF